MKRRIPGSMGEGVPLVVGVGTSCVPGVGLPGFVPEFGRPGVLDGPQALKSKRSVKPMSQQGRSFLNGVKNTTKYPDASISSILGNMSASLYS